MRRDVLTGFLVLAVLLMQTLTGLRCHSHAHVGPSHGDVPHIHVHDVIPLEDHSEDDHESDVIVFPVIDQVTVGTTAIGNEIQCVELHPLRPGHPCSGVRARLKSETQRSRLIAEPFLFAILQI